MALVVSDDVATDEVMERVEENEENSSRINQALAKVKDGLQTVRVSQFDATQVQRDIEGELFDTWGEKYEVKEAKGIPIGQIDKFLDHMKNAYEGIDENEREKMNGILSSREWAKKVVEFKYDHEGNSGASSAKYGIIALKKFNDGGIIYVDCMYCLYKLNLKVAPEEIVTTKKHSTLFGLIKWETASVKTQEKKLGVNSLSRMKNYFRYQALKCFVKEGLIDRINVVPSIKDLDDGESGE